MAEVEKPRLVGFNHIALEVGDIDEALAFYGRLFKFELRGKSDSMAFIDLGDQFIAFQKGRRQPEDDGRHFGLVVDDKEASRKALNAAGVTPLDGPFLDFRDPWGQPRRDSRLRQRSVHQSAQRAARHGADAFGQK
jgi:lactoylglutathione lyase